MMLSFSLFDPRYPSMYDLLHERCPDRFATAMNDMRLSSGAFRSMADADFRRLVGCRLDFYVDEVDWIFVLGSPTLINLAEVRFGDDGRPSSVKDRQARFDELLSSDRSPAFKAYYSHQLAPFTKQPTRREPVKKSSDEASEDEEEEKNWPLIVLLNRDIFRESADSLIEALSAEGGLCSRERFEQVIRVLLLADGGDVDVIKEDELIPLLRRLAYHEFDVFKRDILVPLYRRLAYNDSVERKVQRTIIERLEACVSCGVGATDRAFLFVEILFFLRGGNLLYRVTYDDTDLTAWMQTDIDSRRDDFKEYVGSAIRYFEPSMDDEMKSALCSLLSMASLAKKDDMSFVKFLFRFGCSDDFDETRALYEDHIKSEATIGYIAGSIGIHGNLTFFGKMIHEITWSDVRPVNKIRRIVLLLAGQIEEKQGRAIFRLSYGTDEDRMNALSAAPGDIGLVDFDQFSEATIEPILKDFMDRPGLSGPLRLLIDACGGSTASAVRYIIDGVPKVSKRLRRVREGYIIVNSK